MATASDRAGQLAVAALAVGLLGLALPQLAVALVQLPGDPVVFALRRGAPVSDDALAVLAETREATLRWWPDATAGRELAVAALRLGERARAEAASRGALARAPVEPNGWLRLAWLAWTGGAPPGRTAALLRASVATGPYEPALTALRARIALDLWPSLPLDARLALAGQIRHLWRDQPDALVGLATTRLAAIRIAEALGDREAIAAFVARRAGHDAGASVR
jgi:hypothetical protein